MFVSRLADVSREDEDDEKGCCKKTPCYGKCYSAGRNLV